MTFCEVFGKNNFANSFHNCFIIKSLTAEVFILQSYGQSMNLFIILYHHILSFSFITFSVENGATGPSAELLKLFNTNALSGGGLGALGGLGSLAAASQHRQNGSALIRSYEALLQNPTSRLPPPQTATSIPGPTRRRKKKRRRQPDMPKKACTPFMHFCSYFKKKLMEEGKEFPQFADFGKRAGELWRNMGDVEKQRFNELSELDRQRYIKDMKEYEERKLAEKEREQELQQQRDKELQQLREKEIERLQKQQRDQMEHKHSLDHQQKQQEQLHTVPQQTVLGPQSQAGAHPNAALMNMLNPLSAINPLMMAALNQSIMQTMITNPELFKTMYSEAAKSYYMESLKNYYQAPSPPITTTTSSGSSISTSEHTTLSYSPPHHNSAVNILSLINSGQLQQQQQQQQQQSMSNGSLTPPAGKSPTLSCKLSGASSPNSSLMSSAALDLSSARSDRGSDEGK